jgi:hypothetical protein
VFDRDGRTVLDGGRQFELQQTRERLVNEQEGLAEKLRGVAG